MEKDENIENKKSEGEAKGEDRQHEKPNQQCQNHQRVTAAEIKTKYSCKKKRVLVKYY